MGETFVGNWRGRTASGLPCFWIHGSKVDPTRKFQEISATDRTNIVQVEGYLSRLMFDAKNVEMLIVTGVRQICGIFQKCRFFE